MPCFSALFYLHFYHTQYPGIMHQTVESSRRRESGGPDINREKCWTAIQESFSSILLLEGCASSDKVGGSDTCSQFYLLSSNRDPLFIEVRFMKQKIKCI